MKKIRRVDGRAVAEERVRRLRMGEEPWRDVKPDGAPPSGTVGTDRTASPEVIADVRERSRAQSAELPPSYFERYVREPRTRLLHRVIAALRDLRWWLGKKAGR